MNHLQQQFINVQTDPAALQVFIESFTMFTASKGELLLSAGQLCQYLYFVEEGLLRTYYIRNKPPQEVTSWLTPEGSFVGSTQRFLTQSPSDESIEALEDSLLYRITYPGLQQLYQSYPAVHQMIYHCYEQCLYRYEQRTRLLHLHSPIDKYEQFLQQFPTLAYRAKQKDIASYLGLSPQTISRIRHKLAKP